MIRIISTTRGAISSVLIAAALLVATPGVAAETPDPDSEFGKRLILLSQRIEPPALPIRLEQGGETRLDAQRGEVVVAVFWATWCSVCLHEMPVLNALQASMAGQGVRVLPVSLDRGQDAMTKVRRYLDRAALTHLPAMVDVGGLLARTLTVRGTPTSLILDRRGRITAVIEGPGQWDTPEARAYLRSLAREPVETADKT